MNDANGNHIPGTKYNGFVEAPKVFSTLEMDMVPTGVDLFQCPDCGQWLSEKMSPAEENEHCRRCKPADRWW